MSARLSRRERRLLFAYEDVLRRHQRGRALAEKLEALAAYLLWLHAGGLQLGEAWPQDLAAWGTRVKRAPFAAARSLHRFLYCHDYLGHDPGAVLELPPRGPRGARHV